MGLPRRLHSPKGLKEMMGGNARYEMKMEKRVGSVRLLRGEMFIMTVKISRKRVMVNLVSGGEQQQESG